MVDDNRLKILPFDLVFIIVICLLIGLGISSYTFSNFPKDDVLLDDTNNFSDVCYSWSYNGYMIHRWDINNMLRDDCDNTSMCYVELNDLRNYSINRTIIYDFELHAYVLNKTYYTLNPEDRGEFNYSYFIISDVYVNCSKYIREYGVKS